MSFNAKAARAKRPCPIWVDAFQRDTQHLEADEIGAYFLILMAMWTRESCDFPDDDNRLARVSRVSSRLWKSRIGPVIREFLIAEDGAVFSKRLQEEATYVERQVKQQSYRKTGEKSCNPLKDNEPPSSTDITTDEPGNHPSQQPNSSGGGGGDGGDNKAADQTYLERVCAAFGKPLGSVSVRGKTFLPDEAECALVMQWRDDLELTEDQVVAEVDRLTRSKRDGPPKTLAYFTEPLARLAGELKSRPKLTPIEGGQDVQPTRTNRQAAASDALRDALHVAGTMRRPSSKDCF
ncbi:YdaU family protein [Paracoccus benzoatiresistens]|uniref:DUF1376 domain-containing protein n=1 Tax=Paracoccus benzoatiresistens TaxID=2997341 RepID=A0ABT4J6U9_9RHOB|nr:DUF1376 domain-containing protein [Paracoccus sp. EF6]MCZ0962856.1 DUF1376 domain-containing protein [Paracoccus sp. EF6]